MANRNPTYPCPNCKTTYKTESWLKKHLERGNCKKKRSSISGNLRKKVWEEYVGQRIETKCFCCRTKRITPFTYCDTFHAGHIISAYNKGTTSIENLLPICRDCNMNMGSENWDDYVERNGFPLRKCGKNPPIKKYIRGIIWTQSLVRMWLERKNPKSWPGAALSF